MAISELQKLGIREAAVAYKQAHARVSLEIGVKQPYRGLDVARRFVQEQVGESSGLLLDLHALNKLVGVAPSALALISDPKTAAELLRHEDFKSLSSDHPTYQAFKPYVGEYLVFKYKKDTWLTDRKPATRPFSQKEIGLLNSEEVAGEALDSVLSLATNRLPENWIKHLTSNQVVKHVTGHTVDPKMLSSAIDSHSAYTGRTLREIMIGAIPRSVGKIITYPTLRNYHNLKREIVQGEPSGIVKHVLENLPEDQRDIADVSASLIGGLSTLKSFMGNILYVLAKNPDLQSAARQNPALITKIMHETGRRYPAAPYILRKAVKDVPLGDTSIPKDSLIVFGIFAYGINPDIADSNTFNPYREDLNSMFTTQEGAANVFGYGPRACLGKYLGVEILEATTKVILERYQVNCLNDPIAMIGKGIGSSFDKPVQFRLIERGTGNEITATSKS